MGDFNQTNGIQISRSRLLTEKEFNNLCTLSTELCLQFYNSKFIIRIKTNYVFKFVGIERWLEENATELYYIEMTTNSTRTLYFLSKEDAAHFKLTWDC